MQSYFGACPVPEQKRRTPLLLAPPTLPGQAPWESSASGTEVPPLPPLAPLKQASQQSESTQQVETETAGRAEQARVHSAGFQCEEDSGSLSASDPREKHHPSLVPKSWFSFPAPVCLFLPGSFLTLGGGSRFCHRAVQIPSSPRHIGPGRFTC